MKRIGRRTGLLLALCAALLSWMTASAESAGPGHTVVYFYRNYCEACTPEEDFAREFKSLTGVNLSDCDFSAWNVVRAEGQAALEGALVELGLEDASLPLAIVDGIAYQGASQMNRELSEAAVSWHDTLDSEILFLFVPACESCDAAEAVLDELPDEVTFRRGYTEIKSRVVVERVDISARADYAQALFNAYGVPDGQRVTPIVFYADRYLSGADAIRERLIAEVNLGWASGGVPGIEADDASKPDASLLAAIGAGLVAGLNTCALSMLLLFLSLVLSSGRRALPCVIGFLAAKLACYLLIGFALLRLFQQFNPAFLRPMARWIMTGLGAALIALNLSDALHARRGDLGGIRNQLPGRMRSGLRELIKRLTQSPALTAASVALGFVVAGGEFMCAGQLYLMQLMAAAQGGSGAQAIRLVAYCVAFTVPSAVVCVLLLAGQSQLRAADFFARHMALIKVLTAVMMLVLIITAWLM